MKLLSLKLNNYRQYHGEHEIELAKKGDKGINVIIADNGFGKSSFYRAINWCLYNEEPRLTKKAQEDINSKLNDFAEENASIGDLIEMSVEINFQDETNDNKIVSISRSRLYSKTKNKSKNDPAESKSLKDEEKVELRYFTDSGQQIIKDEGDVKTFVDAHILDDNLTNFFFFDGEDLSEFISDNKSTDIKKNIDVLTDITSAEKTKNQLERWLKGLEDDNKPKLKPDRDRLLKYKQKKLADIHTDIAKLDIDNTNIKKEIDGLPEDIDKLEIYAKAEETTKKLQDEIDNCHFIINELSDKKDKLIKDNNRNIALNFSKIILQKPLKKFWNLVQEKRDADLLPPPEIKDHEALDFLIDDNNNFKINFPDKGEKNFGKINWVEGESKESFLKGILQFNNLASEKRDSNYKNLATDGQMNAHTLLSTDVEEFKDSFITSRKDIRDVENKILEEKKKLEMHSSNLQKIPESKYKNAAIERLEKKRLLSELKEKLSENIGKGKTLKSEFDSLQKEISIDKNKINETSDEFDKILFIKECLNILRPSIEQARNANLDNISNNFKENYAKYCKKKYIASITNDYEIDIKNENNKPLAIPGNKRLGEGETYLAGFCYMLAMKSETKINFPFIIDTPLASCDPDYKEKIMSMFVELTSNQKDSHATFLFQPSEYTKEVVDAIQDKVSNQYIIEKDENDNASFKRIL